MECRGDSVYTAPAYVSTYIYCEADSRLGAAALHGDIWLAAHYLLHLLGLALRGPRAHQQRVVGAHLLGQFQTALLDVWGQRSCDV